MHLVIEKNDGRLYAYREDATQFKAMEKTYRNSLQKLQPQTLDDECDLSDMPNNSYIVFNVVSQKPTTSKKKKKPRAA